jgi:hypothetical protein
MNFDCGGKITNEKRVSIRNEDEYYRIDKYIQNNPMPLESECYYDKITRL